MTQPFRYVPATAFRSKQTPDAHNGADMDSEFEAIQQSIDALIARLELVQRDDGLLRNLSVHSDSLDPTALRLISGAWTSRGNWQTFTDYLASDVVIESGNSYVCLTDHKSDDFPTDLTNGKWRLIAGGGEMFGGNNLNEIVDRQAALNRLTEAAGTKLAVGTTNPDANHIAEFYNAVGSSEVGIRSNGNNEAIVNFGDTADRIRGRIAYNHAAEALDVFVNGAVFRLRIDSAGRLLLGHQSSITTASLAAALQVSGESTNDSAIAIQRFSDDSNEPRLVFANSRGAVRGSFDTVQIGDLLGRLIFAGADGADFESQGANIIARVDGVAGPNDLPGSLSIGTTAPGTSAPTERLRINSSGDVGVGTASPARRMHIRDEGGVSLLVGQPVDVPGGLGLQAENDAAALVPMELRASDFHFGTDAAGDANIHVGSINDGPLGGFRNVVINGGFDIWQRGAVFTPITAPQYTTDRWQVWDIGGANAVGKIERGDFTAGQTDVPNARHFLHWECTTAGDSFWRLFHKLEDAESIAGQSVTISFYAKAGAPDTDLTLRHHRNFGASGSTAVDDGNIGAIIPLTTSWARYTRTAVVPSNAGKTIGTGSFWALEFQSETAATFDISIANVQVEAGMTATPFERRPVAAELDLCRRYYRRMGRGVTGHVNTVNTEIQYSSVIDPPMRMAPAMSLMTAAPPFILAGEPFTGSASVLNQDSVSPNGFRVRITGGPQGTPGHAAILDADDLLSLDAEL